MPKRMTLYRRGQALVPRSKAALLELERIPENMPLKVDASVTRGKKFHRMVMALFSHVAEALNQGPMPSAIYWDVDEVNRNVKVATGYCDDRKMTPFQRRRRGIPDDAVAYISIPKSISFDAMDEDEFQRFAIAAAQYIAWDLAPWLRESPAWAEVNAILLKMGVEGEHLDNPDAR